MNYKQRPISLRTADSFLLKNRPERGSLILCPAESWKLLHATTYTKSSILWLAERYTRKQAEFEPRGVWDCNHLAYQLQLLYKSAPAMLWTLFLSTTPTHKNTHQTLWSIIYNISSKLKAGSVLDQHMLTGLQLTIWTKRNLYRTTEETLKQLFWIGWSWIISMLTFTNPLYAWCWNCI